MHNIHAHKHKERLILMGSLKPLPMAPPPGPWLCSMTMFWHGNLQEFYSSYVREVLQVCASYLALWVSGHYLQLYESEVMALTEKSKKFPGFYIHPIQPNFGVLQLNAKIGMACCHLKGGNPVRTAMA